MPGWSSRSQGARSGGNRWISSAQGVGLVASARSRTDQNTAASPLAPTRSQSLRSPFGPRSSGGMRTRLRAPNVRASAMARSVASRSSATYTRPARRNSGSHAGCQPPVQ